MVSSDQVGDQQARGQGGVSITGHDHVSMLSDSLGHFPSHVLEIGGAELLLWPQREVNDVTSDHLLREISNGKNCVFVVLLSNFLDSFKVCKIQAF